MRKTLIVFLRAGAGMRVRRGGLHARGGRAART